MIKILAIGNSFSQNATVFVERMAKDAGIPALVRNMYIGGCSLETHVKNIRENNRAYSYQTDGQNQGIMYTVEEGLLAEDWDIVTLQQVSGMSGRWETYEPYLSELSAYVKKLCPNAKQVIHQTWAYEKHAPHSDFPYYGCDQMRMHIALSNAYRKAAHLLGGLETVPSGDIIATLRTYPEFDVDKGGTTLSEDGFHLCDLGKYAAALAWFKVLLGGDIKMLGFIPDGITPDRAALIKEVADNICR